MRQISRLIPVLWMPDRYEAEETQLSLAQRLETASSALSRFNRSINSIAHCHDAVFYADSKSNCSLHKYVPYQPALGGWMGGGITVWLQTQFQLPTLYYLLLPRVHCQGRYLICSACLSVWYVSKRYRSICIDIFIRGGHVPPSLYCLPMPPPSHHNMESFPDTVRIYASKTWKARIACRQISCNVPFNLDKNIFQFYSFP